MPRTILLRGLSLAAVSLMLAAAGTATPPVTINGGGAVSPQQDLSAANNPATGAPRSEFSTFNAGSSSVQFGTYWATNSGVAQNAFLRNDLTCLIDASTSANGGSCIGPVGGTNTVHYVASDATLTGLQISSWANSTTGQTVAGNLIQLPSVGTASAIAIVNGAATKNGRIALSDNDLCGIFSGLITNFSQITDSKVAPAPGTITLVYRTDTASNTLFLTGHLAAACNSGNTASGVTFSATTSFASLFPNNGAGVISGGPLLATAHGVKGQAALANYLAGLGGTSVTSAIGYLAPDWTSVVPTSLQTLSNGKPSPLIVAALTGSGTVGRLPTVPQITIGLTHPGKGTTNAVPPNSAATGANPALWVPLVPAPTKGYPIVGYGTFEFAQCYSAPAVTAGVMAFLTAHYTDPTYRAIQESNGLVPLSDSPAARFIPAITAHILSNGIGDWQTDIGDATACAGKSGR